MPNKQHRILIVEDETKLGNSIQNELLEKGFDAVIAYDGLMGERYFKNQAFDLVLLDINLPEINGIELCRRIRLVDREVPIIMLTALGQMEDKLSGFSVGADDYMVKPFYLAEMLARIKVFLKRNQVFQSMEPQTVAVGDLEINLETKSVQRENLPISLTAKEFSLLLFLAKSPGRVFSKQEITEKVWAMDFDTGTNTIEVYISFLRNKIDRPFAQKMIHTKPGFGYYLSERP